MLLVVIYFFGLLNASQGTDLSKFAESLRVGIRLASSYLNSKGSDVFFPILHKLSAGTQKSAGDGQKDFIPKLLKIFGLETSQIEDYAFSSVISLTSLISEVFITKQNGGRKRRFSGDFAPFEFIINQPKVVGLLSQMQDPNLGDLILKEAQDKLDDYPPEDVECIKLLVCKISPFVKGMQRSLRFFMTRDKGSCRRKTPFRRQEEEESCDKNEENILWENSKMEDRMYFFIPNVKEVVDYGDKCDLTFPNCLY